MSKASITTLKKTGAVLLLLGVVSAYFGIFRPLQLVHNGVLSIKAPGILTVLATLFVIFGATYLWFPQFVQQHLGVDSDETSSNPKSMVGWVFVIASLILAIGLDIWLQSYLKAHSHGF